METKRRRRVPPKVNKPAEPEQPEQENEENDMAGQIDDSVRIIERYKARVSNPLTGIRAMCVECMGGGIKEISECASTSCALHPFRMGKKPFHGRTGTKRAS